MPTPRIANLDPDRLSSIMNSAIEEFATFTFEQASFNRIIKNSGLSKGSLYYYFNSKEDLFLTILDRSREALQARVKPDVIQADRKAVWAETKRLLEQVFQFFQDEPELGRFVQTVLSDDQTRVAAPAGELLGKVSAWLADFLATAQELGAVRDDLPIELLEKSVWSLWRTIGNWQIDHGAGLDGEYARESASLMTNALARLLMPGASKA